MNKTDKHEHVVTVDPGYVGWNGCFEHVTNILKCRMTSVGRAESEHLAKVAARSEAFADAGHAAYAYGAALVTDGETRAYVMLTDEPPGLWFVAAAPPCFGIGATPKEARRNLRKAGGRGRSSLYACAGVRPKVDSFGRINRHLTLVSGPEVRE